MCSKDSTSPKISCSGYGRRLPQPMTSLSPQPIQAIRDIHTSDVDRPDLQQDGAPLHPRPTESVAAGRSAGVAGAARALHAVECVQMDPLNVVARGHHLALLSRVHDYQPEQLDNVMYRDRAFFDYGGGECVQMDPLNVVARGHHLALLSRVHDYQPEQLDNVMYRDRAFFDYGG